MITPQPLRRLPPRPIHPAQEFGHPWPRPIIPVRCPKCRKWYVPTRAMAGGLGFKSTGRRFSKRGLNFQKADGTCPRCDCDNPPGSGRNTIGCNACPDNQAPASVLVSMGDAITLLVCGELAPPFPDAYVEGDFPDICVPGSSCAYVTPIRGFSSSLTDPTPPPDIARHLNMFVASCAPVYTFSELGFRDFFVTSDPSVVGGPTGLGMHYVIVGTSFSDGTGVVIFWGVSDFTTCTETVEVENLNPPIGTTFALPGFGTNFLSAGESGTLIVTPQFSLCA